MTSFSFPDPEALSLALARVPRRELPPEGYVRAAVLLPLTPVGADYHMLLTRRTDHVETHKGQVAFPGGMKEEADGSMVDTALRETEEEIGISPAAIRIAGILDDLATPTGYVITPVVGLLTAVPPLVPNAAEVAEVFSAPLSFFADGRNARSERRRLHGKEYEVWSYSRGGHLIWGVTAAIIRSLLRTLSGVNPPGQTPAA